MHVFQATTLSCRRLGRVMMAARTRTSPSRNVIPRGKHGQARTVINLSLLQQETIFLFDFPITALNLRANENQVGELKSIAQLRVEGWPYSCENAEMSGMVAPPRGLFLTLMVLNMFLYVTTAQKFLCDSSIFHMLCFQRAIQNMLMELHYLPCTMC